MLWQNLQLVQLEVYHVAVVAVVVDDNVHWDYQDEFSLEVVDSLHQKYESWFYQQHMDIVLEYNHIQVELVYQVRLMVVVVQQRAAVVVLEEKVDVHDEDDSATSQLVHIHSLDINSVLLLRSLLLLPLLVLEPELELLNIAVEPNSNHTQVYLLALQVVVQEAMVVVQRSNVSSWSPSLWQAQRPLPNFFCGKCKI